MKKFMPQVAIVVLQLLGMVAAARAQQQPTSTDAPWRFAALPPDLGDEATIQPVSLLNENFAEAEKDPEPEHIRDNAFLVEEAFN